MDTELRRQLRMAMRGVPERLGLSFASGGVEMRARSNGTPAGTAFEFRGYAAVYDHDFQMWDPHGEPYTESVAFGVSKRSLGNPNLDVPFLIGHNDAGIPLARMKSGTMKLAEDTHGTEVHVPSMDGRREEVRALASAVERGDMDEMSLAFICTRQEWDPSFEHRTILEWDLHRGDVCAVVHGANPGTAGAWMSPVEQLSFRRPVAIGGPRLIEMRAASAAVAHGHPGLPCFDPDGDGDCDMTAEGDTDHDYWSADGHQLRPLPGDADYSGELALAGPYEQLSVSQAERDKAHAAGNSLPDKTYPINNAAQLHSAAVLAASHHGDWKAAQTLIRRRAKELGVDVTTLPGFGEQKSSGQPHELRASAAEDLNLASSSDYNPSAGPHEASGTHDHGDDGTCQWECAPHGHFHNPSAGTSATVTVDGTTGIPGPEESMSAQQIHQRRVRELELEELSAARVPSLLRA